jgi:hypothetical protein
MFGDGKNDENGHEKRFISASVSSPIQLLSERMMKEKEETTPPSPATFARRCSSFDDHWTKNYEVEVDEPDRPDRDEDDLFDFSSSSDRSSRSTSECQEDAETTSLYEDAMSRKASLVRKIEQLATN